MKTKVPASLVAVIVVPIILACNLAGFQKNRSASTPPAAATNIQSGIPFFASPIKLVIPNGLAGSANATNIDTVTDQDGTAWEVAPAHVLITLQGYLITNSFHVPQIFVYPASNYARANASAAMSIKQLQTVLSNPNGSYTPDQLPRVPFFHAGQVFAAQEKTLQFNGGSGVRFVTQYAQDISPVNNGGLFYHFEGLSSNGKYYILAILPTNLPFLPADNNPASSVPSSGFAFPQNNSGSDVENYLKQVTDKINAARPDEFNPSLTLLDALIQSISTQ
jgi:hypothetical protein